MFQFPVVLALNARVYEANVHPGEVPLCIHTYGDAGSAVVRTSIARSTNILLLACVHVLHTFKCSMLAVGDGDITAEVDLCSKRQCDESGSTLAWLGMLAGELRRAS